DDDPVRQHRGLRPGHRRRARRLADLLGAVPPGHRDGHDADAGQPQHADPGGRPQPGRAPHQHRDAAGRPRRPAGGGAQRRRGARARPQGPAEQRGEPTMTATPTGTPAYGNVYAELEKIAANLKTFNRLVTTNAKIAQTPKEVVWRLNKAKLYRYVPVLP